MALRLQDIAQPRQMDYTPQTGQSAFLQGLQEAQALGNMYRQNQTDQRNALRMEQGRGIALGAIANPNDPNARATFARGLAEQGNLEGAKNMLWPQQSGGGLNEEERAINRFNTYRKDIDDNISAYQIVTGNADKIDKRDVAITTESPEGRRALQTIVQTINEYMRQMSGAAVTESEATRLLMALGVPQLASYIGGVISGADLAGIIAEDMRKNVNSKITFNPAAVYNAFVDIGLGLRDRTMRKISALQNADPVAYEKIMAYANAIFASAPQKVAETADTTNVSETTLKEGEFSQRMGKAAGADELAKQLLLQGSKELQKLIRENEALKASLIAESTLDTQKILAAYTSSLATESAKQGLENASQLLRNNIAKARAALKEGAIADAQNLLAGSGITTADLTKAMASEKVVGGKSKNPIVSADAPRAAKKEAPKKTTIKEKGNFQGFTIPRSK